MSCPACARRSLSRASVLLGVLAAAQAPPRPPNALTPHVIDPALWRPIDSRTKPVRPLAISTGQALSLRQDPTVLLRVTTTVYGCAISRWRVMWTFGRDGKPSAHGSGTDQTDFSWRRLLRRRAPALVVVATSVLSCE